MSEFEYVNLEIIGTLGGETYRKHKGQFDTVAEAVAKGEANGWAYIVTSGDNEMTRLAGNVPMPERWGWFDDVYHAYMAWAEQEDRRNGCDTY